MIRKAFTLIELLVVIAIIAILAAILFPVFAQAKQAAKKTAAISNNKQITLAALMYSGDADDLLPVFIAWSDQGAPAFYGGKGYQPWTWLVMPYMKSGGILEDPQAPATPDWGGGWPKLTQQALETQFGYNYTWLSPLEGPSPTTSKFNPRSQTSLASPAETVMVTAKFSSAEDNQGPSGFYWYGYGSISTMPGIESPHCASIPQWCFDDWGLGGFFDATYLKANEVAGSRTGGMSIRGSGNAIVAWADGHVSAKKASAMAVGTDWTRDKRGGTKMTDVTKYLWDDK